MHTDDSGREIRKRAEAIAQQSSAPGVSAEDKLVYELLFDWAPVPYFVFNAQGGIIEANQAGVSLLKTERRLLDQKPFVVFLSEEHHAAFFDHIRRVLEGDGRQNAEVQIKTHGGSPFWVRLESRPRDTGKGITQCLTAVIDVSDRKRIEDDLILAREDAVSADRAKSAFLANMSHEIRTPMNGILSMSEVALGAQGLSDELERYLRTIHSSAASLISILDDVLDLSRIETDRRTIEKEPFRPAELIHTVEAMFGPNMTEKQLSLHVDVTGPLSDILVGDRNRLRQILVNLLSNAITYSNAGEIKLRVTESEVSGFVRELTFEVHDTGPGIDPAEQQRIRELFKRNSNDAHQRYEGAGLGLAISRRLASLLGGQLYFETNQETGTRFFCSVPLELPGEGEAIPDIERAATSSEDGVDRRILVAEDNAINLLVIRTVLEKENYEVISVSNGQDALDTLARTRFDLVLMDISMPGMDGITATRTIRSHTEGLYDTAIPVIAISAHSMKGDRERFLAAGMNDYISKPFVRETVLSVIKRHLGSSR